VKPFYYAQVGNSLVFSNTLNCVRLHPAVSDELNDIAIADFLMFGYNQEPSSSTFADIKRLPPAHYFTCSRDTLILSRYWMLPTDGQIRYRRAGDYIEHFRELLRAAVEDRLRTYRVWVWMSGGLDSTSIAAVAHERLSEQFSDFDLRACTEVYDTLLPDEERRYAGLVAEHLNIPIHFQALDGYIPFERWDQPELHRPEPFELCLAASEIDECRHIAASQGRILLCGYGGDPALIGESIFTLTGRMRFSHLVTDVARLMLRHHRMPPTGIRGMLRKWFGGKPEWPPYPNYFEERFATKLDLPARWKQLTDKTIYVHRLRPRAYENLVSSFWAYRFESHDPGATLLPVEARYPFFDRRLLEYMLAVPAIPWCINKGLLREAMRGILPEAVRLRPKTHLVSDPIQESLKRPDAQRVGQIVPTARLAAYVNEDAVPHLFRDKDVLRLWVSIRVLCLDYWLRNIGLVKSTLQEENHELAFQEFKVTR
jgi:asparagine synthase (glutamine-hydrolysing)